MRPAPVETVESTRVVSPTPVPLGLRVALHRAAARLAHAAQLATIAADGSMPERGAGHVLGILDALGEELAVFRSAVDAASSDEQ